MLLVIMVLFISSMQPMMMMSGMILVTLFYSFYIYMSLGTYWFSYALIMVMLSGVLVVFTYFLSFIPNEKFEMYNIFVMLILLFLFLDKVELVHFNDYSYMSFGLWFYYCGLLNLFLVVFLLMMMMVVMWLSYINEGSIRVS